MPFSPEHLLKPLTTFAPAKTYWVAFSGGLDSHVLLYALAKLRAKLPGTLRAIHINHGLQAQADNWAEHCEQICKGLGLALETVRLQLEIEKGASLEAVAREARYAVFTELLKADEAVLTAHHQDDQAETVLLQLLRGAGPSGLGAMAPSMALGQGRLLRPLLKWSRNDLRDYAMQEGLHWIEDDSNRCLDFDRNYLRHEVLPLLKARWPGLGSTLSRSARHSAEAAALIGQHADRLLQAIRRVDGSLALEQLVVLGTAEQRWLLRAWIREAGLPIPDATRIDRILSEVVGAAADGTPLVDWPGAEVRRYRGGLYLLGSQSQWDSSVEIPWVDEAELTLPAGLGRLQLIDSAGAPLRSLGGLEGRLTVRFRQGGEICRPLGRGCNKSLKSLFQEAGVLPWMRAKIPLVYLDGALWAVAGICHCELNQGKLSAPSWQVDWSPLSAWRG